MQLTKEDIMTILGSLEFTKKSYEDYDKYPSYEFKQERILKVSILISKIKTILKNFAE